MDGAPSTFGDAGVEDRLLDSEMSALGGFMGCCVGSSPGLSSFSMSRMSTLRGWPAWLGEASVLTLRSTEGCGESRLWKSTHVLWCSSLNRPTRLAKLPTTSRYVGAVRQQLFPKEERIYVSFHSTQFFHPTHTLSDYWRNKSITFDNNLSINKYQVLKTPQPLS